MIAPLVLRPKRLVVVGRLTAGLLVLAFLAVALLLRQGGGADVFGVADQFAMVALGLMLAAPVVQMTRVRVVADTTGVRVRNMLGERALPWQVVRAVRLDDGDSWASLDLHDDDTIGLMAVQSNDKEHAVQAVLALRALLREAQAHPPGQA